MINPISIKEEVIGSLINQGYKYDKTKCCLSLPSVMEKEDYRNLNAVAVSHKIESSEPNLKRHEDSLLEYIANGNEVIPEKIKPVLIEVLPKSEEELLFRYASIHWSIPVSAGYGRRLRFLIFDQSNSKLIGLFGLGDPVYSLESRDSYIGWDRETKKRRMYHILDAFVLGAVQPYSQLIAGKLIAMLTLTNEVRDAFKRKYRNHKTLIKRESKEPWLLMLTTTSALGRSSIYNRIKYEGYEFWKSIGYTQGTGEFHFSNGVYLRIREYVEYNCVPTAKNAAWGRGFRNKREVVKKFLQHSGLSANLLNHGIKREVFVAPLASNSADVLCERSIKPDFYDFSADYISELVLNRWVIPRAERKPDYRQYHREEFRIWNKKSKV